MRMRKTVIVGVVLCAACLALLGCSSHKFERKVVLGGPAATRLDRVRQYSLEDQYRIFRYGNDIVEPPLLDLAKPIAERGASAVPFLLKQLNSKSDDEDTVTRDVLLVFEDMTISGSYDATSDPTVMATLSAKIAAVKDKGWRDVCYRMFERMKRGAPAHDSAAER